MNTVQPVEHSRPSMARPPVPGGAAPRAAARVPAVARALAVLDLLVRERRPLSMATVAQALHLPRSSVHGLCSTLLDFGYLRRTEGGQVQIGPGVMGLAEAFVASTHVAGEFEALWREAGTAPEETQILSVLNGTDVVYVGVRNAARPLGLAFTIGMRLPAHLAATGKAMLAHQPCERLLALYGDTPLSAMAGPVARTLTELQAELALVRERGYSVDDGGVREGVYSVASPVFDATGAAVAGLGVCINKAVLTPPIRQRQCEVVMQAAQRLSQRLGARVA